jgi:metal-sulfur cluster biosynthetic enzyme
MMVSRDFYGLLVPSAMPILVLKGTQAEICRVHDNFATMLVEGSLIRVNAIDFDAIGVPTTELTAQESSQNIYSNKIINNVSVNDMTNNINGDLLTLAANHQNQDVKSILTSSLKNDNDKVASIHDLVWQALRSCYDPEISINIVDLGLIYDCVIKDDNQVSVTMTLTSPTCGMGPMLITDLKEQLYKINGITQVEVITTFDPPWTVDRMSEAAKLELGLI